MNNITYKISQGMYVLTTQNGGCMVDSVSQVSAGEEICISVAVSKNNNTNSLIHKNKKFAISVLGKSVNPNIIKTFGFNSMRDIDKFSYIETTLIEDLNIINDSLGYIICELVDVIDVGSHDLFIGKIIKSELINDEEEMTYAYYQKHKDELLKVETESGRTAWICTVCGYVYFADELPDDFICPVCGVGKEYFKKRL